MIAPFSDSELLWPALERAEREQIERAKLERITEWTPAFDKRDADPNKNYGIHSAECRWVLRGEKGAVQFVIFTSWHLPHVQTELARRCVREGDPRGIELMFVPMAADLGYHSPTPRYGDQPAQADCPYLGGKPCYYDGSGLRAEAVLRTLIAQGGDAVWRVLESEYFHLFEKAEAVE